jgi:hypothetical protein
MDIKFFSFINPRKHLVFDYYIVIAPSHILSEIELEAKGYGLKHSIANLMNQPSCTLDETTVLDYTNQGRALLLLVFNKTLRPPFSASNTLKIVENRLEIKKLWASKVKGVKNSKKNY